MNDTSTGFFSRLVGKTRTALRGVAARHALRQELLECDRSGTLDIILADINMSRDELKPLISNYPLSGRLFGAMAARLGVDPAQDGPVVKRELQRTCALCSHQSECQHWLDSGRSEGYEEFCPNSDYWHELKERISAAVLRHGILAATDGSESADRAIDVAADMARKADCDLFLVNVAHVPPHAGYSPENLDPGLKTLLEAERIPLAELYESTAKDILAKAVKRAEAQRAPRIHTLASTGETAEAILEIAKDRQVNTIVVGKRGLGRLAGLLNGSISQKLAAEARCTIVIVP